MDKEKRIKKVIRACPIFLGGSGELLYEQRFHLYQGHCLLDAYDVVSCIKCGFVYADSGSTQKDYNRYYSEFSKYENSLAPGGLANKCDLDKYERMVHDLSKIIPDKDASILDIGCAKGGLLATFKAHGYKNLTGLDPSLNCVAQVKAQDIPALQGGLFLENFPQGFLKQTFDCVIVSHVLEHVYDLSTAVKNAFSLVKTGGFLYLEVPDSSRYTQYYVAPYHYFDFEHINHFDLCALNNLLVKSPSEHVASGKKDLQHSNTVYYPAVYSVYRKRDGLAADQKIVPDHGLRDNVIRYIEMSRQADHWPELDELAASKEAIVVWGAGAYALRLYRMSPLSKCNIVSFIDNDLKKRQAAFDTNVTVKLPKEVLPDFKGTIVVCSAVYNNEIVKEIDGMRLNNRVVVLK
jgi:SAM-dependent methyltransferase